MMNKKMAVFAAGVLGLGLVLSGISTAAYADAKSSVAGTYGYYNTNLDRLSAMDLVADGLGTRVWYQYTSTGAQMNLDNSNAAGSVAYRSIGGSGNIRIRTCSKNGAANVNCADWTTWTAR